MCSRNNKKEKKRTRNPVDSEHIQHAEFIKNCHLKLRLNSMKIGADKAWQNHCSDDLLLNVRQFHCISTSN